MEEEEEKRIENIKFTKPCFGLMFSAYTKGHLKNGHMETATVFTTNLLYKHSLNFFFIINK